MEKEYYTKEEVDFLLNELKSQIISAFSKANLRQKKTIEFLDYNGRLVNEYNKLNVLRIELIKNKLIEEIDYPSFRNAFSGKIVNNKDYPLIKYIGQINLLPYLLDGLIINNLIESKEILSKAELIFGVDNLNQSKSNYKSRNEDERPKNHEIIDEIIFKLVDLIELDFDEEELLSEIISEMNEDDEQELPFEYYKQFYTKD